MKPWNFDSHDKALTLVDLEEMQRCAGGSESELRQEEETDALLHPFGVRARSTKRHVVLTSG